MLQNKVLQALQANFFVYRIKLKYVKTNKQVKQGKEY